MSYPVSGSILHSASSGGGPENPMLSFMNQGTVAKSGQNAAERQLQRSFYTITDNQSLRKYVNEKALMLTMDMGDWLVSNEGLPFKYTDDLTHTMRRVTFDTPLPGEVPNLGHPRLVERGSRQYQVSSTRYGIALKFEGDQINTTEGRQQFDDGLTQLAIIMHKQANNEVMCCLVNPQADEDAYLREYSIPNFERFQEIMRIERDEFGIFHKLEKGIYMMHEKYSEIMFRKSGVYPDVMVVGKDMEVR